MYQENAAKKKRIADRRRIKKHYVLIKDFNSFMYDRSLHRGRKHFCHYCLHAFITEEVLKCHIKDHFKGPVSGLRQFLATESPFKMMKNAFYFTLKALFILKIFKFLA